jgi:hypothetical protein
VPSRPALGITLVAVLAVATIVILNTTEGPMVTVIASKEDIPANELLDPLIEQGNFKEIMVPVDLLVWGAVPDVDDLRGMVTSAPILANEQISIGRIGFEDGP